MERRLTPESQWARPSVSGLCCMSVYEYVCSVDTLLDMLDESKAEMENCVVEQMMRSKTWYIPTHHPQRRLVLVSLVQI